MSTYVERPQPFLDSEPALQAYPDGFAHLQDELRKLDLILARQTFRFRQELAQTERFVRAAPHYVSDEEVDFLLLNTGGQGADHELNDYNSAITLMENTIAAALQGSVDNGVFIPLLALVHQFNLSPVETQVIILCLAPELRKKYSRIYAYLQDDIGRKRPTVDLALQLLFASDTGRWRATTLFAPAASLRKHNIVHLTQEGVGGLLNSDLQLDERIFTYLMGFNTLDARVEKIARVFYPSESQNSPDIPPNITTQITHLLRHTLQQRSDLRLWLHLNGRCDLDKTRLIQYLSRTLNCPVLEVDLQRCGPGAEADVQLLRLACREAVLGQALVFFKGSVQPAPQQANMGLERLTEVIEEYAWLAVTEGEQSLEPIFNEEGFIFHEVRLLPPETSQREALWLQELRQTGALPDLASVRFVAENYRLSARQIRRAAAAARVIGLINNEATLSQEHLVRACRNESRCRLDKLAAKVQTPYRWQDLVLPQDDLDTLHAICHQVKHRQRVMEQWGFQRKLTYGSGLSVLFSGKPGTGKTLAAQVLANELQRDLYKIDLAGVVSKYIGETEKNLDKIFTEARGANAILFFDEADALFGKRSEISDAHDRYANIETSYLLQKMEEYEGIVILASNYRKNMDEAFVRRIRFIIEFPFPDVRQRLDIWRKMIPAQTPTADDIDYDWLTTHIKVSGGSIKNIVLNSAFHAAAQNRSLSMDHLRQGCRDEFKKVGRLWNENDMVYENKERRGQ